MAQAKKSKRHHSAIKAARQAERRRLRNRSVKRAIRLKVREAAAKPGATGADALLREASSLLDKAADRGVIHWKAAARKKSRLAAKIRAASKAPAQAAPAAKAA